MREEDRSPETERTEPGQSARTKRTGALASLPRPVFAALVGALLLLALVAGAYACLLAGPGMLRRAETTSTAAIEEAAPEETAPEPETKPEAEAKPETEPEAEPEPEPDDTEVEEARLLAVSTSLGAREERALLDADYRTELSLPAEGLTVTADETIAALYLIWADSPGEWELESGGAVQRAGQDGFLHELVLPDDPSATLTIRPPAAGTGLCDLYAYSAGKLPADVQQWSLLRGKADLLIFSTHADDELVFFGGLIPYYAAVRGKAVQLVYMTTNAFDEGDYRVRPHEALNGLWTAGARYYPVTNKQPDRLCQTLRQAEELYGTEQFRMFQVEQIRKYRPDVIVTQDHDGEYGHGAHLLTVRSLEWAVPVAANGLYYAELAERYGAWDTPKTYLHLYGPAEERTVLDYETPAEALGGRTPFETARLAYEKHETQQKWDFEVYGFGSAYDSHSFGLFRTLVGPDEERRDLFEHLP